MGVLKNDVGRPSNKTIMTRTILKAVVLILFVVAAFIIGTKYNNTLKKESQKREALSIDSEIIEKIYQDYDICNDAFSMCASSVDEEGPNNVLGYFYLNDSLKSSEINNNIKIYIGLRIINGYYLEGAKEQITKDEMDEVLKKLFGKTISYDSYKYIFSPVGRYEYKNNIFTLQTSGVGDACSYDVIKQKVKAEKIGDTIELYERVGTSISCDFQDDYLFTRRIYNKVLTWEEIRNDDLANNYLIEELPADTQIQLNEYVDKLTLFKWTFTKDANGDYKFTKIEKVD